jgi:hypothetical protein
MLIVNEVSARKEHEIYGVAPTGLDSSEDRRNLPSFFFAGDAEERQVVFSWAKFEIFGAQADVC